MLFGAKRHRKYPLDVGELRQLVTQLDNAQVPDEAILRGRTIVGGRLCEITVDTRERLHGSVKDVERSKTSGPGWTDPKRPS